MKVIILAGGSGERLWPLSRGRYPKQFVKLKEDNLSLFQDTFKRSLLIAKLEDIYVVTNEKYKFLVMGNVEELGYNYNESNIIVEPEAKNTLPAIYAGVNEIVKKGSDSVVVFPSDHVIKKEEEFIKNIKASESLSNDFIITFGIKPDRIETGYGYIAPTNEKVKGQNGYGVEFFKEKPQFEEAARYIEEGYYWNAGIFMFNAGTFINEVKRYAPNIYSAFEKSNSIKEAFSEIKEKISIDFGLMEKSREIVMVPVDIGWNDLGSFKAFDEILEKDNNNNIVNPENILIDSKDNYIYSEKGKLVATIGINDSIIVDNKDALLICKKEKSQEIRDVVKELKSRNDSRVEYHTRDYRPWGHYKVLEEEKGSFKIKRISIGKGKTLSYQMHKHRSEHWIVVKGVAKVIIDGAERFVSSGESLFIKPGQKHRLENFGDTPLEVIEVQMGNYLEEDDIVRFDELK